MRLLFVLVAALGVLVSAAGAEPYWIAYEGDDFPENEGWERVFSDPNGVVGQGGAIRTLENGALVLDSRESVMIVDFCNWSQPINPEPGERFVMRWRVCPDEVSSDVPWDSVAGVFSDAYTAAAFQIGEDRIRSTFEPGKEAAFLPHVFHTFEFISLDMISYELYIDGTMQVSGMFEPAFEASRVGWGDGIQGASSLTTWDRFEFGVIPESRPGIAILVIAAAARRSFRNR